MEGFIESSVLVLDTKTNKLKVVNDVNNNSNINNVNPLSSSSSSLREQLALNSERILLSKQNKIDELLTESKADNDKFANQYYQQERENKLKLKYEAETEYLTRKQQINTKEKERNNIRNQNIDKILNLSSSAASSSSSPSSSLSSVNHYDNLLSTTNNHNSDEIPLINPIIRVKRKTIINNTSNNNMDIIINNNNNTTLNTKVTVNSESDETPKKLKTEIINSSSTHVNKEVKIKTTVNQNLITSTTNKSNLNNNNEINKEDGSQNKQTNSLTELIGYSSETD